MKRFWVKCSGCGDTWVASFADDYGILIAIDSNGEECSDCGTAEPEIQDEYEKGDEL